MSSCTVKALALLAVLIALIAAAPALFASVVMRSGVVINAPVESVSPAGVELGGDAPRTLAWDSVRAVTGEASGDAKPYMPLAEQLWRARTRLARGDVRLASPAFAELYEQHAGAGGPTGLRICEGHLRCRVIAGDVPAAVGAWLRVLELRRSGVSLAGDMGGSGPIDRDTGLFAQLPPIFTADSNTPAQIDAVTERWAGEASGVAPGEEDEAAQLALLYRAAARAALREQIDPELLAPRTREAKGVAHVRTMLRAMHADDSGARAGARAELARAMHDRPGTFIEAWSRAAIGRSLAKEADRAERLRGVLQLAHVPARFLRTQPYLAGICLADAAATLDDLGRADSAAALRRELERALPGHPAIQSDRRDAARGAGAAR